MTTSITQRGTLNLFSGTVTSQVLRVGENVVLYQSPQHKQSSLVGKRVTYLGVSGSNDGIDLIKFRYYRHSSTLTGNGRVVFPASIPEGFDRGCSVIGDDQISTIFPANRNEARGRARHPMSTRFASESIKINYIGEDTIDLEIEIEATDFSFAKYQELNQSFNWKTNPDCFAVATHARAYFFTGNTIRESGYDQGESYTCIEGGMMGVTADGSHSVPTYPCYSLSDITNRNDDRESFYVSTFRKLDDTRGDVGFIKLNDADEIFVEPTEQWVPEFSQPGSPVHSVMISGIRAASRLTVQYITNNLQTTYVLIEPAEQPSNTSSYYTSNFDYGTLTTSARQGTSVRFHMPNEDDLYQDFLNAQAQQQMQGPPPKFKVGDIVTQKQKNGINLGHKTWRKDWKITQITAGGLSSPYRYGIASVIKKNMNRGTDNRAYEEELELVDKEKKRKFEITKDFKKYKAGTVMNKEELVTRFQKFQDTAEPLLLNKIYICAE